MGNQQAKLQLEAEKKIEEAEYFLELLSRLEKEQKSITQRPLDTEATYLTSALISACASVLFYLEREVPSPQNEERNN